MDKLPSVTVVEGVLRRICASRGYVTPGMLKNWLRALGYGCQVQEAAFILEQFLDRYLLRPDSKHPGGYTIEPAMVYVGDEDYYDSIWDMDTVFIYELLVSRLKDSSEEILAMVAELAERAVMVEQDLEVAYGQQYGVG